MNKVYKVIWSKVKNCYVVASELAKSHTKAPDSGTINRVIVAGILACVLSGGAVLPVYADVTYSSNTYMSQNLDFDFSNKTVDFFNAYPTYDSYQSELTVNYNSAYQAYRSSVNEVLVAVTNLKNAWDNYDILCDAILNATSYSSFNDSINQLKLKYPTLYERYNIHPVDSFMVRQFAEAIGGTAITEDDIFLDNVILDYSVALSTYENNLVLKNKLAKAFGQNSIAIGKSSVVNGNNSIALGIRSSASDDSSLAIGIDSSASNTDSIAIGSNAKASGVNSLSFGHNSSALGNSAVSLGNSSSADGTGTISIGNNTLTTGKNAIGIGSNNGITGIGSIALGSNNIVSGANSVAFGNSLNVTENNVLALGGKKITGVTAGVTDTDAVNVGQLNNAISDINNNVGQLNNAISNINNNVPGIGIANISETAINYNGGGAIGYDSIAIGDAKSAGASSIAIGSRALVTGTNSIAIGTNATATGDGLTREQVDSVLSNNQVIRDTLNDARADYTASKAEYDRQKEVWEGQNEAYARVQYANQIIAGYQNEIDTVLQPNADTANANYNQAKSAYDTLYNDFQNRIGQIKTIDFSLYADANTGAIDKDTIAIQLKNNTEAGTSFNMPVSFYSDYIDSYIKANGDLRQNQNIANSISYREQNIGYINNHGRALAIDYPTSKVNTFFKDIGLTTNRFTFLSDSGYFSIGNGEFEEGIISEASMFGNLGWIDVNKNWATSNVLDDVLYEKYKSNFGLYCSNLENQIRNNVVNLKALNFYNEAELDEYQNVMLSYYSLQKDYVLKLIEVAHEQYLFETSNNDAEKLVHLGLKEKNLLDAENISSLPEFQQLNYENCSAIRNLVDPIINWCYENVTVPKDSVNTALQSVQNGLEGELVTLRQALNEATTAKNSADRALANKQNQINQIQPSQEDLDAVAQLEASAQELQQKKDKLDADSEALEVAKANLQNLETIATEGESAIAIGDNAITTGKNAIGIGTDVVVTGIKAIGIGKSAIVSGENSVAIGADNSISTDNSVAIGSNNGITGTGSIALGSNNIVSGANSVALGNSLNVTEDNVLALGGKKIIGVTDGVADTDAVTVGQMNTAIQTGITNLSGDVIHYDVDNSKTKVTLEGSDGTTIDNVKDGTLSENSKEAVNGSQLYSTNQALEQEISNRTTAISDEVTARMNADTELQNSISTLDGIGVKYDNAEIKTKVTLQGAEGTIIDNVKDATLSATSKEAVTGSQLFTTNTNLANEISARESADTTLQSNIDAEQTARETADTNLGNRIDTESSARETMDTTLQTNITNEATAREQADTTLQENIDAEATARSAGDTALTNKIGLIAENGNYIVKDNTVFANLSVLDTNLKTTVDALSTEITNRTNADSILQSNIDAEVTAREQAIAELTANMGTIGTSSSNAVEYDNVEKSKITLGGGETGTFISNVKDGTLSADSKEAVNGSQLYTTNQNLSAEITNRENAEAVLQGSIDAEVTARETADATLQTNIANEVTARENADTALSERIGSIDVDGEVIRTTNNISQNITALDTGLKNVKQSLSTEIVNRQNADEALSARIGTIEEDGTIVLKNNNVSVNLKALNTAIDNLRQSDSGYDDDTHTSMTFGDGVNPVALHNVADGNVSEGSKDAVNGSQLYQTNQAIDNERVIREQAVQELSDRMGVVDQDGNTILKNKSIADNLKLLDNANKANADAVTEVRGYVDDIQNDMNSLQTSVNDMQITVNGLQQDVVDTQSDVNGMKSDLSDVKGNITMLQNDMETKVNADASNIDTAKWLEKLGTGKAEAGNKGLVTGETLYNALDELNIAGEEQTVSGVSINSVVEDDTNHDSEGATGDNAMALGVSAKASGEDGIAIGHGSKASGKQSIALGTGNNVTGDHSGAFGDPNDISGTGSYAFGNDNTISGNNTFVLGNNVTNATGSNSVVLGNGSDGSMDNVVSVGSEGAERKIVHVANGDVSANSKDAVNGGQLYQVQKDFEIAKNIDVSKWAEKLGTGEIANGDSNLVTGGTVYNAIKGLDTAGGTVVPDMVNNEIHIGGNTMYDAVDVINVSKSDGGTRVITGIATNPQDPTSAANVGYVNAISQNIVNGMNNEIRKIDDKFSKAGASAAAMASLEAPPMDGDEKWAFSAAVGHYDGETAGAVGAFYRPQDNVIINIRGAVGNGEDMIGAGVGVALQRGNTPSVSKAQLVRTINAQSNKMQEMEAKHNAEIAEMKANYNAEIAEMKAQMAELAKQVKNNNK